MNNTIEIRGLNGLRDLRIDVSEPGVYVLRGPNGAGKTSTLEAVSALLGDATARAEPTDGLDSGSALGPGVTLRVRQRRTRDGQATIELLDRGPIGALIDPRIANRDAAARAQVSALLEIVSPAVTPEVVARLSGGVALVDPGIVGTQITAAAANLKRVAESKARALEAQADRAMGEVNTARSVVDVSPNEPPTMTRDEALALVAERQRAAERLRLEHEARRRLERQQEEAREQLGPEPDVAGADEALSKAGAEVARIDEAIRELETLRAAAEAHSLACSRALGNARREAAQRAKLLEVLERPVEGPTEADVRAAEQQAQEARDVEERVRAAVEAERWRTKLAASIEAHNDAAREAKRYREVAEQIPQRLSEILAEAGVPNTAVVDGRLVVAGKDFATRHSTGQRVRYALGVALEAQRRRGQVGECPPLLVLDASLWAALDPERRAEVVEIATEVGVALVTEEPAEGVLRIEKEEASHGAQA